MADNTNTTKQKIRGNIFGALDKFRDKKIIVFGAGNFGSNIFLLLNYIGVDVAYIIDNDTSKQGLNDIYKKEICSIKELQNEDRQKILIIVAVGDSSAIIKSLQELGFSSGVNYIDANIEFAPHMKKNCDCFDPQLVYTRADDVGAFKVYKNTNDKPKLKMLVLGASHTDWSFYSLKSWPEMLFEKLSEKKQTELYNGAIYGYTSRQELCKLMRDSLQIKPDIIINYSGSNDAALSCNNDNTGSYTRSNASTWLDNIRIMSIICKEYGTKFMTFLQPSLFVSKYVQSGDVDFYKLFAGEEKRVKSFYCEVLENIKDKNYIIDLHTIFDNKDDIYIDGIHYTEKAHSIVAEHVLENLSLYV